MGATTAPRDGEAATSSDPDAAATAAAVLDSLRNTRFELIPLSGVEAQVPHLPDASTVTVTASPTAGLEATLDLVAVVAAAGHRVVPHLSARLFVGPEHLAEVLDRVTELGVDELFVPAGDAPVAAGPYEGAADVLPAIRDLGFTGPIGITGYPESHHLIDDATTIQAMAAKAPHADHVVSQICYDPATTAQWIRAVRARGIDLPIQVGIPGVVPFRRLLRISMKVGLGDSIRYLSHQHGVARRLLSGYDPGHLVDGLATTVADPDLGVTGWHLFTFNAVEASVAWWRERVAAARAQVEATTDDARDATPPTGST
ncbi:methylenetetrahydrofolate reductase [Salsipaludibacter albus]|uniref:methylenetetrahydrofolate reductase n=1 Tax=Salsipaludibacter albus TaxID=2849650 RepID=UPI001EE4CDD4